MAPAIGLPIIATARRITGIQTHLKETAMRFIWSGLTYRRLPWLFVWGNTIAAGCCFAYGFVDHRAFLGAALFLVLALANYLPMRLLWERQA
jgi:hypothetical protein